MPEQYVIQGYFDEEDNQYLYWSNDNGWSLLPQATKFTLEERCRVLTLPICAEGFTELDKIGQPRKIYLRGK